MVIVPILPRRGQFAVLPSADGKIVSGLFADWTIEVENPFHTRQLVSFRIDPGAECSGMSQRRAQRLGLLRNDDRIVTLPTRTAGAVTKVSAVRIGKLVVHLPALRSTPFEWPIVFHADWVAGSPPLLGLAGVVADLSFLFRGDPIGASDFGSVAITVRDLPFPAS